MHKDSEDIPIRSGDYHATHSAAVLHHSLRTPLSLQTHRTWNNIVHTAIDSYTGFILSRTHDKHQWLLLSL